MASASYKRKQSIKKKIPKPKGIVGGKRISKRSTVRIKRKSPKKPRLLEKFSKNPILEPDGSHPWESKAAFNPGAFSDNGKVYLLYRAIGDDDISVLGFASSDDGITMQERLSEPAYAWRTAAAPMRHDEPKIAYLSGGGWNGGCEDPRLTLLDGRVHLIFTAFDGWSALRIALTSVSLEEFRKKNWQWEKPVFISPPGEIHKNWVIFPEKIKGKYAVLHSIAPKIAIDYVGSLDAFDGANFIYSKRESKLKKNQWDSLLRGAGPPPIKTKSGWLLFYHAIDHRDPGKYKLGAMLLDLKNPAKILYRSKEPVLEPEEPYENEGFKAGIVYSCGAAVVDDKLLVYYGGADTVACVATANLSKFIRELKGRGTPKLKAKNTATLHGGR